MSRWPAGLVAFWDFAEGRPPFEAQAGVERFPLRNGTGSDVRAIPGGPFGHAARFDGQGDHLVIPGAEIGALNLSRTGDACTVLAWVQREAPGTHFIAGMWQEDANDPRRQYGLFVSLPVYGGAEQVCGHVSRSGGPTPGYADSRDYSATARVVAPGRWWLIGFTYDGEQIVSYLDGVAEGRPEYTDFLGNTYAKNPYRFLGGLNRSSVCDFTVGAVRLTAGMCHFLRGSLGGLAVFRRALTPEEMMAVHRTT